MSMTENQKENLDALNQDDTSNNVEKDDASQEEDGGEDLSSSAEKLKRDYENQKKRAEKAEATLKDLKSKLTPEEQEEERKEEAKESESSGNQTNQTAQLSREEAILFSKGHSDAQVEYAKKVANLENVSLLEAVENPIYQAWSASEQKRIEKENAELGASKGSQYAQKKKDFNQSLSAEEHKQMWKDSVGL